MRLVTLFLASAALACVPLTAFAQLQESGGGQTLSVSDARKLLGDRSPQVRLRAALVLTASLDAQGVGVLIDLLDQLPVNERRQAEQALRELAGEWSPNPPLPGEDELSRKIRREVWAGWWRTIDGPSLLAAFRQRTLSKEEAVAAQALIDHLRDKSPITREKASTALKEQGVKVIGLLRAAKGLDLENQRAIDVCLQEIIQDGGRDRLPRSAPGLLAAKKPAGAEAALLAYLPSTDDPLMRNEISRALKCLLSESEKLAPAVLQALSDPLPLRRVMAAEVLVDAGGAKHWPLVRPLLKDADSEVRLRVATALVNSQDRESVPALIALLAELPRSQVSEAEWLLQRLAGAKAPSVPRGPDDAAARKKLGDAWQAWWKEHGATVDLAELAKTRFNSGLTLVAIGDSKRAPFGGGGPEPAGQTGKVLALDREGKVRWQIDNLEHPIDVQFLPGQRVLIAEYYGRRVTERDEKGKILWEVKLPSYPVNVQRLANGNTFIALYGTAAALAKNGQALIEVDPTGKIVANFAAPTGAAGAAGGFGKIRDAIFAAQKLPDGKVVCLMSDETCVWLDATGKEVKRVAVPQTRGSTLLNAVGNIDLTPSGHVLFAHVGGLVTEYDANGKVVAQTKASGHRATRLANGNTLVALVSGGVVELDTTGRIVWQFNPPNGQQVTRARRQ